MPDAIGPATKPYLNISATNGAAAVVKAGPGRIMDYFIGNDDATTVFVKIYDALSATSADTPKKVIRMGAGTSANLGSLNWKFEVGICIRAVTGQLHNDDTAPTANKVSVNFGYY